MRPGDGEPLERGEEKPGGMSLCLSASETPARLDRLLEAQIISCVLGHRGHFSLHAGSL